MSPKIVDHKNTMCIICGNKTNANWYRYYDKNGYWDMKSYICNICYNRNKYPDMTKIDLKNMSKRRVYYNRTNTCDRCGINFEKTYGHPYREYNNEGNWTGKWLCAGCKYKISTDRRLGCLNPNSEQAKGDMFEELTCIWRGVENLNTITDCYNCPNDHTKDKELGIIQTKGKLLNYIEQSWSGGWQGPNKEFDNLILYCTNKDGKIIERIYIFPKKEVIDRTSIHIYKNPSRGGEGKMYEPWYEKYRVKEEEILQKVNKIWNKINPKGFGEI